MKRGTRIAAAAGILLMLTAGMLLSISYQLPQFHGSRHYEASWQLSSGGKTETIELPAALKYSGAEKQSLSTILTYEPKDTEAPYAFIAMNHMYFQVYLNDRLIYSYTKEDTADWSKSPGNAYMMIPLDRNCAGRELRIDFWMTLEDGLTYEMEEPFFGDYGTVLYEEFWHDLPHNIVTLCILALGAAMVILSIIATGQAYSADMWHIGLFAVLFGIYTLSENQFNLFLLANPYFAYLINIFVFAAIQLPLLLFFRDKVTEKFKRWYNLLLAVCSMNLVIQIILHFLKIKDLRQMLIYTHLLYGVMLFLIIFSVIKIPKEEYRRKKYILLAVFPILAGAVIDAVYYYTSITDSKMNTFYSQFGVLIFLIVEAVYMCKNLLIKNEEKVRSEFYRVMAYKDGLTGIYNRTAFMEALKTINENRSRYKDLVVVCVDLNNLKVINDSLGHQAGDKVLCKAAELLQDHIGKDGAVFRTGGDEFVAIVSQITMDGLFQRFKQIEEEARTFNRDTGLSLDFAMGCEVLGDGEKLEVCIKRADEKMYEDKRIKKSGKSE